MTQTEKAAYTKKKEKLFKKDWKIVLFFGDRFFLGKKVQVVELPSTTKQFQAHITEAILSVDYECDKFTMFNTGPCRYIGFNVVHYAGQELPMAFSKQLPAPNTPLDIEVVSLSTNTSSLVNNCVFVTKVQKLKDNLYRIITETDDYYFVTIE